MSNTGNKSVQSHEKCQIVVYVLTLQTEYLKILTLNRVFQKICFQWPKTVSWRKVKMHDKAMIWDTSEESKSRKQQQRNYTLLLVLVNEKATEAKGGCRKQSSLLVFIHFKCKLNARHSESTVNDCIHCSGSRLDLLCSNLSLPRELSSFSSLNILFSD